MDLGDWALGEGWSLEEGGVEKLALDKVVGGTKVGRSLGEG